MELLTATEWINCIIGGLALIGGIILGLKKIFGGGNNGGPSRPSVGRAEIASKEARCGLDELWDKKQGKEMCDQRYDTLRSEMRDIKKDARFQRELLTNIAVKFNVEIPKEEGAR